jgi:hypothetical protein
VNEEEEELVMDCEWTRSHIRSYLSVQFQDHFEYFYPHDIIKAYTDFEARSAGIFKLPRHLLGSISNALEMSLSPGTALNDTPTG